MQSLSIAFLLPAKVCNPHGVIVQKSAVRPSKHFRLYNPFSLNSTGGKKKSFVALRSVVAVHCRPASAGRIGRRRHGGLRDFTDQLCIHNAFGALDSSTAICTYAAFGAKGGADITHAIPCLFSRQSERISCLFRHMGCCLHARKIFFRVKRVCGWWMRMITRNVGDRNEKMTPILLFCEFPLLSNSQRVAPIHGCADAVGVPWTPSAPVVFSSGTIPRF